MGNALNNTRVLQSIRAGAQTAADVWADLDFQISKPLICAHLSILKLRGLVRETGSRLVPFEWANGRRGRARVLTYEPITAERRSA